MIVEISGIDMLKLANGEQVAIGDLILREGAESQVIGSVPAFAVSGAKSADEVRARRSEARRKITGQPSAKPKAKAKPKKTGQRWMHALFPGRCYFPNCRNAIVKGDMIVYDYDGRRSLCEGHGKSEYPNLPRLEEVNA